MTKKQKIFIIDTSVLLSGKPLHIEDAIMVTTPAVSQEIRPGGRDYRFFELLQEKGLMINQPSKKAIQTIQKTAEKTGDIRRLSSADIEILALAFDIAQEPDKDVVVLTDDYSIQNVANVLNLIFQSFSQQGITKRFKWHCRCPGCGKQFRESVTICPICGTKTKTVCQRKTTLKRSSEKP